MHVLLVKLSSLGDIVHTLPAVEDATRRGTTFDWVVEEDFAAVPAMHRGVREVIRAALRRWRTPGEGRFHEIREFGRELRRRSYDLVIDAQGLIKSALIVSCSRSRVRAGYDRMSAREPAAALFYSRREAVETKDCHAIERIRRLFAATIGYDLPTNDPAFGLNTDGETEPYCVLLHGTTWESKHWPEAFWTHIAHRASQAGLTPILPWLSDAERRRAENVAHRVDGARAVGSMPLDAVADLLARASAVVGVDTGLAHLSAALGRPTVGLFGPTDARLTGCVGSRARNIQGDIECAPCLSRHCGYRGDALRWQGETVEPACFARLDPDRVWTQVSELLA